MKGSGRLDFINRKRGFPMKPDLRNVLIDADGDREAPSSFLVRHQAFPELSARRPSLIEALADLLAVLKELSGSFHDVWRELELDRAVFDAESLLLLMVAPGRLILSGHQCAITKTDDLICFVDYAFDVQPARVNHLALRGMQRSDDPDDVVAFFAVGRRCADRRAPAAVKRLRKRQPERRLSQRRRGERRQFNRLEPVAQVAGEWTASD